MKHVNAYVYYGLSAYIRDAVGAVVPGTTVSTNTLKSFMAARSALDQFQENEDPTFFRSSIAAAKALSNAITQLGDSIFKRLPTAQTAIVFTPLESQNVAQVLSHFESLLSKDLSDLPLFCVDEKGKGNFSLPKLIKGASDGYPAETLKKLPVETRHEIDEAGRCLAFTRPTASACHILRALELVTKAYITHAGLTMPPPNRSNWGEYIRVLRDGKAPKEITDLLQIIKDNYRNPIMHPEASLALEEAGNLFCICQSAVEVLCR